MKYLNRIYLLLIGCLFTLINCSDPDDSNIVKSEGLDSPIVNEATDISTTGFSLSWTRVYKATSYEIDISKSKDFLSFVAGFEAKSVSTLKQDVIGLEEGTTYFLRIRAKNATEISANSRIVEVSTLTNNAPDLTGALKVAATSFFVGMAVKSDQLTNGSMYNTILKKEFSSISAEYEMKMNVILPSKGNYNWSKIDAIVDYAIANGINVHGHALVWHESMPDWLKNYTGTNAEFEQEVKNYITAVLTRYKGKITSWDVVNEGINDTNGGLRETVYKQKMGDDYIAKCFQFARDADPNVLLFYNDYSVTTNQTKQNAIFSLVDNLKSKNIIDGVGFQMHIQYNSPTVSQMKTAFDKVVDRGLKLHVSELDIRVNPNKDITTFTEERALAQKTKVKEVVQLYNAMPKISKYAITMWGMKDDDSWLLSFHNNYNEWPLLYDSNFKVKKAHAGFLEGLK